MNSKELLNYLSSINIEFKLFEHEPLFTSHDGEYLKENMPGAHVKNLFLKDKKKNYFLITVLDHKQVDLKILGKMLLAKDRLSFASAQELKDILDLTPGSVTAYGLINDKNKQVKFVLDKDALNHEFINFHPLINDKTISVRVQDFSKFLESINNQPQILDLPLL